MIKHLTEVTKIPTKLPNYWPQFIPSPYAYYNRECIHLFHHPHYNNEEVTLAWNNQFTGCTSILFKNEATAIVDTNHLNKEEVYATLIHELFHCHQYHMKETRFPNELVGITYPLENSNIKWRIQERECLHNALHTDDIGVQKEAIQAFIYWREKREEQYSEFVQYENLIETIEGPAFFIEYLAYKDILNHTDDQVLARYIQPLTDYALMTKKVRQSCYMSGLAICLLLEKSSPTWKEELFEHQLTLFDVLKKAFEPLAKAPKEHTITYSVDRLILEAEMDKQNEICLFKKTKGYLFTMLGQASIQQFDPMNITKWEKNILHKKGMTLSIQEQSIYFSQPVLALTEKNLNDVVELQFFIDLPPEQKADGIFIKGIGHFRGVLKQSGVTFQFVLSK